MTQGFWEITRIFPRNCKKLTVNREQNIEIYVTLLFYNIGLSCYSN